MKKILSFLVAAPLMLGVLAGCGPTTNPDQEALDKVANLATLLLDSSGQIKEAGKNYQTEYGDTFLGLKYYQVSAEEGDQVTVTWSDNAPGKVAYAKVPKQDDRTKISPTYPLVSTLEYDLELTALIEYKGLSATRVFKFHIISDVVESVTLKQLREKIAAGTASTDVNYETNGIITGYMEPSDSHLYAGVYVQDGPWALMLYAGKMSSLWDYDNWTIGTRLHIVGKLSPYNGLNELKPSLVELASEDVELATPTPLVIEDGDDYGTTQLFGHDGRLVEIRGAKFVSTETLAVGSHKNIKFSLAKTSGGTAEIVFRVNYHIGTDAYNDLIKVVNGLKAGDLVNLYGVISWYNTPQISPQFIAGKTPAQCIEVVQ